MCGAPSGLPESGDAIEREEELLPDRAFAGEALVAGGRQAVVAAAPLAGLLDPSPLQESVVLEAVEGRVERGDVVAERPLRSLDDQASDLVAVAGPLFDERQDQEVGGALLLFLRKPP